MRDRREVRGELGVVGHRLERGFAPVVPVPPDQRIDDRILTEARHARRKDDQLAAVRHGEPRSVDRLVREPGRAIFVRVEVRDAALKRRRERLDVDRGRERNGRSERSASGGPRAALPREDASQHRPVVASLDDGQPEQHPAARLEETVEAAVEQQPDRSVDASERLFDPVDRTQEMAALNRLASAEPDRDVLRVAAEPGHLVRHDLPDGDDQVVGAVDERAVDGERQAEAELTTDDVVDLVGRKLSDRRHIVAPAVMQEGRGIDGVAEHQPRLGRAERLMRPERGHDIDALHLARQQPVEQRDDLSCARVQTRLVGRNEQHTPCSGGIDLGREVARERAQLLRREGGARTAGVEERLAGRRRHARRISGRAESGSGTPYARPVRTAIARYVPILRWAPSYERRWLRFDILAGIAVWAVLTPQAIAYASLAGAPPEAGFYAATAAVLAYALLGTCKELSVGPSTTPAITAASIVAAASVASNQVPVLLAALALVSGAVMIASGSCASASSPTSSHAPCSSAS